jgi:hypothetical protein
MLDREARERGSVLSSAKTCLLLFKDPVVAQNTAHCGFRLFDLMNLERPVSLYIVTRGADKERLRPVVRLLLTMAMRVLMGVELKFEDGQPVMPHKHRLLLMLDEFPSLGRMQLLEGALPKCAGYGIKAFLAAQDREQMFRAYGEHQSITANCHVPGHADGAARARHGRDVKRIRHCRHVGSARASRNYCATAIGIDGHPVHPAEIDDDAGAQRASGPVVPAAPHRQGETAIACRSNGQLHVFGRPAVNDGTRHAAYRLRPDRGRGVIAVFTRP